MQEIWTKQGKKCTNMKCRSKWDVVGQGGPTRSTARPHSAPPQCPTTSIVHGRPLSTNQEQAHGSLDERCRWCFTWIEGPTCHSFGALFWHVLRRNWLGTVTQPPEGSNQHPRIQSRWILGSGGTPYCRPVPPSPPPTLHCLHVSPRSPRL
jgi:hypothetical protein